MLTDEKLRIAAAKASEQLTLMLEEGYDTENQHVFSKKFERRIKRLARKTSALHRVLHYAAILALVAAISFGTWLSFDAEARTAVVEWFDDFYSSFIVIHHDIDLVNSSLHYQLGWIPEGYKQVEEIENAGVISVIYINEASDVLKFQYGNNMSDSGLFIEHANDIYQEVDVHGYPAKIFIPQQPTVASCIVWDAPDGMFYISGYLSKTELLKIADQITQK